MLQLPAGPVQSASKTTDAPSLLPTGKRVWWHAGVPLDIKDWGQSNGFCKIGDGDVDWAAVRVALDEIGFTGWAAAEVGGGDRDRLADISRRMDHVLSL